MTGENFYAFIPEDQKNAAVGRLINSNHAHIMMFII
jgi:hypothetical protein